MEGGKLQTQAWVYTQVGLSRIRPAMGRLWVVKSTFAGSRKRLRPPDMIQATGIEEGTL